MTLRTLNYGNYGIFLIMGNAGFCPSTVVSIEGLGAKGAGMLGGGGGLLPKFPRPPGGFRGASLGRVTGILDFPQKDNPGFILSLCLHCLDRSS